MNEYSSGAGYASRRWKTVKLDANRNAKTLADYLRKVGLLGESVRDPVRDYASEAEEVLHNACLAADDLARRLATV